MDDVSKIKRSIEESSKTIRDLGGKAAVIKEMSSAIIAALKSGGKLIAFGNGGSASDCEHMVGELVGRFNREKKPIPAISLTANTSVLTAIGNDYGYDYSFSKQVEAHARKTDVVFAVSTSGDSKNVVEGLLTAKKTGCKTVGLSGKTGGRLSKISDLSLVIPSTNTARIQESHITVIHILCELIEDAFI